MSSTPAPEKPKAPPRPPKIPLPPSEDPPPYTPVTATLLPQTTPSAPPRNNSDNSNPRVVRPTGFRRFLGYCTKRNCILLAVVIGIVAVLLLALNIWLSLSSEENKNIYPLEFSSRSLARFHLPDQRISYDELSDSIILSRFYPAQRQLKSEKLVVNEYDIGFLSATQDIDGDNYEDCMRFTDHVVCCETATSSRHHKTDCWGRKPDGVIQSHASHYDFVKVWQSLENEQTAVLLYNRQRHAVLHMENNKIYKIEENNLPEGYISVSFYFPMDNIYELDELVRSNNEFKICEYTLDEDEYRLKDETCKKTLFDVEFELNNVKFCSNPIYEAVLQYGHYRNEDELSWHLRVKFDSSNVIYDAHDKLHTPFDQLTLDCNDENIDLYILASTQAIEYNINLPDETNAHFKKRKIRHTQKWNNTQLFIKNSKYPVHRRNNVTFEGGKIVFV